MMNFLKEAVHSATEGQHKEKEKEHEKEKPLQTQALKDVLPKGEESKKKEDKEVEGVGEAITDLNLKDVRIESVREPTIIEKEVEAPITKETVIPQVNEIVQPVIMRDTERTQVKHITQPIFHKSVLATQMIDTELSATSMPDTIEKPSEVEVTKYRVAHNREVNTTEVMPPQTTRTVLPPVVKERITPVIHEEIQPVIYQETVQPVVIRETKPVYHKVVEAPTVIEEVRPLKTLEEAKNLLDRVGQHTITGQAPLSSRKKEGGQQ